MRLAWQCEGIRIKQRGEEGDRVRSGCSFEMGDFRSDRVSMKGQVYLSPKQLAVERIRTHNHPI